MARKRAGERDKKLEVKKKTDKRPPPTPRPCPARPSAVSTSFKLFMAAVAEGVGHWGVDLFFLIKLEKQKNTYIYLCPIK